MKNALGPVRRREKIKGLRQQYGLTDEEGNIETEDHRPLTRVSQKSKEMLLRIAGDRKIVYLDKDGKRCEHMWLSHEQIALLYRDRHLAFIPFTATVLFVLEHKFPGFAWEPRVIKRTNGEKTRVHYAIAFKGYPTVDGERPTLYELLVYPIHEFDRSSCVSTMVRIPVVRSVSREDTPAVISTASVSSPRAEQT